jgi:hypothetical protein
MGPVTDTHRLTYVENFRLALQEKRAQFDSSFSYTSDVRGKQMQVIDLVGKAEARLDAAEGGDTPDIEQQHEPVWMRPRRIDWGKVIKKEDQIKALTDFKSEYVQSGAAGIVRQKNALLASALFGPRLIGNEVPVSTAWAGKTVAADVGGAGDTGMNVKKILRAMRYMEEDYVTLDEEELFLALDPLEQEQLWGDLTFVNKDYREQAQLDNLSKRAIAIFGIPIIPTQRVANIDGTHSASALFAKSGVFWGEAMPLTVMSQPNPNKQYREHPYAETWIAATRVEDAKVVRISSLFP